MLSTSAVNPKPTPVSVKLEAYEKQALTQIAAEKSRSVHYLLREAVHEYIERETARLEFKKEADEAWKHYNETGLHLNQDEIEQWANSLYSDENKSAPSCHE